MAEAKKTTKKAAKQAELTVETVKENEVPEVKLAVEPEQAEKTTAKAGKRSARAVREEEAKEAKAARKTSAKQVEAITAAKPIAKPPRTKLERAGKKYRDAAKLIEDGKLYGLAEALELAVKNSPVNFDASIELHVNLGVDPKQADQNVRDTVVMPAGTGKDVKVETLEESKADRVFAKLDKEEIDFDVLIATPAMMPRLGKYARLLGPRGLMPNPKSGTVTSDVAAAVQEAKAGKVEYRVDQSGIIHLAIGKASFTPEQLVQNAEAVIGSIRAARPASLKGIYLKSAFVSSTMGPSVKLDLNA
jgi:large subunit ribosomal protein L1